MESEKSLDKRSGGMYGRMGMWSAPSVESQEESLK